MIHHVKLPWCCHAHLISLQLWLLRHARCSGIWYLWREQRSAFCKVVQRPHLHAHVETEMTVDAICSQVANFSAHWRSVFPSDPGMAGCYHGVLDNVAFDMPSPDDHSISEDAHALLHRTCICRWDDCVTFNAGSAVYPAWKDLPLGLEPAGPSQRVLRLHRSLR